MNSDEIELAAQPVQADGLEVPMPFEFIIQAVPLSLQNKTPGHMQKWQQTVRNGALEKLDGGEWAHTGPMYATVLYFPSASMTGDVDNIVKPILDALIGPIYVDDKQVQRVLVQKFEPGSGAINVDSVVLATAVETDPPVLYVRIDSEATKKDTMP